MKTSKVSLNTEEVKMVLHMPHGIRATYLMWRFGLPTKYVTSAETYSRHKRYLLAKHGIDITTDTPL